MLARVYLSSYYSYNPRTSWPATFHVLMEVQTTLDPIELERWGGEIWLESLNWKQVSGPNVRLRRFAFLSHDLRLASESTGVSPLLLVISRTRVIKY